MSKNTKAKNKSVSVVPVILVCFIIFVLLFVAGNLLKANIETKEQYNKLLLESKNSQNQQSTVNTTPVRQTNTQQYTSVSDVNPKIDCAGPDGKHFQATQKECDDFNTAWGNSPKPDPNEIIKCNMHVNCGGGTKEMTRSSCEQSTCCSLSTGNILTSPSDCKQKQYTECVNQLIELGIKNVEYYDVGCGKYK